MNQSIFTIGKPVLLTQLKDLVRPFGRMSRSKQQIQLELTVTEKLLTLVVPGARFEMYCETRGTCKAVVGLYYFLDIISGLKGKVVTCAVKDNTVEINGVKITAETTFFSDDSILRSIKLPLNYSDWHILRLEKQGYTDEELLFNKIYGQLGHAKEKLTREIEAAARNLQVYGIKQSDIEDLVIKKLYNGL